MMKDLEQESLDLDACLAVGEHLLHNRFDRVGRITLRDVDLGKFFRLALQGLLCLLIDTVILVVDMLELHQLDTCNLLGLAKLAEEVDRFVKLLEEDALVAKPVQVLHAAGGSRLEGFV
jgi:hypothetical protein